MLPSYIHDVANHSQKVVDDRRAFVIAKTPAGRRNVDSSVDWQSKGNDNQPTSTTIPQTTTWESTLLTYRISLYRFHLVYHIPHPNQTVLQWHPEPPRLVVPVADLRNSNSFSSVPFIPPRVSILTHILTGESAVGKVGLCVPSAPWYSV